MLGLSVNLGVQFLLNPQSSKSVLLRGLTTRLDAVESLLRRLAAGKPTDAKSSSLVPLAMAGVVEQMRQLKLTGAVEPWLKKYADELRAQFIIADRLVTAAAVLEMQGIRPRMKRCKNGS